MVGLSHLSLVSYCKLHHEEFLLSYLLWECNTYLLIKSDFKAQSCWVLESSLSGLGLSQLKEIIWQQVFKRKLKEKCFSETGLQEPLEAPLPSNQWEHHLFKRMILCSEGRTVAALYAKEPILM